MYFSHSQVIKKHLFSAFPDVFWGIHGALDGELVERGVLFHKGIQRTGGPWRYRTDVTVSCGSSKLSGLRVMGGSGPRRSLSEPKLTQERSVCRSDWLYWAACTPQLPLLRRICKVRRDRSWVLGCYYGLTRSLDSHWTKIAAGVLFIIHG